MGESHGGLILFRRSVRSTDCGEQARLVTVGFHEGWNFDKLAKEFNASVTDLSKISDELEEQRLAVTITLHAHGHRREGRSAEFRRAQRAGGGRT